MGLFKSLFKKEQHTQDTEINESVIQREADNLEKRWIDIPAYIPAEPKEYQLVSIVATAIAAGEFPESRFVIKKIAKRNPEAKRSCHYCSQYSCRAFRRVSASCQKNFKTKP